MAREESGAAVGVQASLTAMIPCNLSRSEVHSIHSFLVNLTYPRIDSFSSRELRRRRVVEPLSRGVECTTISKK
jgi:hypothetical protein